MKIYLMLALSLAATGYSQEFNQREVLARLKALETEMAKRPATVRWAYADKSQISTAIYVWSRDKAEELKKAEALPPDVEEKVARYEALRWELIRLPSSRPRPVRLPIVNTAPPVPVPLAEPVLSRFPLPPPNSPIPPLPATFLPSPLPKSPQSVPAPDPISPPLTASEEEKAYEALTRRVAEAKAPVAAIVERRSQLAAKYHSPLFLEQLVAEYVRDRYDLVVDKSNDYSSSRAVLYRTAGEVPDITEGIIKFFQDKEKP